MKYKISFLLFLYFVLYLLQGSVFAKSPTINSFLGVPWGSNKKQVETYIVENNFKINAKAPNYITFRGNIAGELVEIRVEFINDSMYFGSITVLRQQSFDSSIVSKGYENVKKILVNNHGTPNDEKKAKWYKVATWNIGDRMSQDDQVSIILRMESPAFNKMTKRNQQGNVVVYYTNESLKNRLLDNYNKLL